jgi:hypothetical protein
MNPEFKYIDRNKRLLAWTLKIIFAGLVYLSLMLFWTGKVEWTLFERWFSISKQWRILGYILFPISIYFSLFISKHIKFKNGTVLLTKDRIELKTKSKKVSILTNQITELKVIKDMPYEGDTRSASEIASRIILTANRKSYDFEVNIETKQEFEDLTPVFKHWKNNIATYSVDYKI